MPRRILPFLLLIIFLTVAAISMPSIRTAAQAQNIDAFFLPPSQDIETQQAYPTELQQAALDEEIEHNWKPAYLNLATGDPSLLDHGIYPWPFDLDSIGWSMQSYQDYGGTPYFHHGMDMMKYFGTNVINQSGGQVINIENYQPGWNLYWEVAILDPDGYIWQYHHIQEDTIPQYIWDKWNEYLADPINGGFIPPGTHIGNIIEWPVWSFGKQFNHIHLNILAAGGVYVNGFEFHDPLPDTVGPEIQGVGLLQNGQIYPGNSIEGDYSLYVHARDLILDDVYYLPPWEITFSVDGAPVQTTWRFDTLPGGADDTAYLDDFYVVPPTCGNYDCRDYYIDLGFIPDSQFVFPITGGIHTVDVMVSDYAGSVATQSYTYTVIGPPPGTPIWQDDFESDSGWVTNPDGSDTATSGQWERGDPEGTSWSGPKQLGTTPSGLNDLVTGRLAGGSANSYDIDGGVTSIRSPEIALPADSELTLSFRYYLAHANNSSNADYLRVIVEGTDSLMVFEERGAASNDDGVWAIENVSISSFAGQAVHLFVEAADEAGDSLVESAIDNVVIVSTATNHAPIADPQSVITAEDTPQNILLTGSDADGNPITFALVSYPMSGTLSGQAPDLVYTPHANYYGTDSFTFHVNDGMVNSEPATVSIEVTPVNDPPVANPQSVSTDEDTVLDITLSGSDLDNDPISYTVVTAPVSGTLSGLAPNLTYTPATNYNGADSFTFLVNDGELSSEPATVSIEVAPINDPPVAETQVVTTAEDAPLSIILSGSDIEGDDLTYSIIVSPTQGMVGGSGSSLVYTPTTNFNGADSLTFIVNDGLADSDPANVNIDVTPVNDAPIAYTQHVSTDEDTPLSIVLSGMDPDEDAITYSLVSSPTHGTLEGVAPNLTYIPAANFNGADNFTFRINDGQLSSETAIVSIRVFAVNDAPHADPQSVTTSEDKPIEIILTGSDLDGDPLSFTILTSPISGSLSGVAPDLIYTPDAGFAGKDGFTFLVNDGYINSEQVAVNIEVVAVNDAPVAEPQSVSTFNDTAISILVNGSDPNNDELTYSVVSSPIHGTLSGEAPNLVYMPAHGFVGLDGFSFSVNDGELDSNIAVVSITVKQILYVPVVFR